MKSIIAAGILLASAPAAMADLSREEPFAIRACGDAYAERTDVCYGQRVTGEVFPLQREVGLEVDRYRTVRVNCDLPRVGGTVRGDVAVRYCPAAADGTLAPAPFLD